jgi:hypothetical protein
MTRVSAQGSYDLGMQQMKADHDAEVKLLREEIERLRGIEQFAADASRHERDGLRAEVERLTNVLKAIQIYSSSHDDARGMAAKVLLEDPKP